MIGRVLAILVVLAVFLVLVGPFFVPVPALRNTLSPQQLADPDSRFIDVNGLNVHYKSMGRDEPAIILIHGFSASTFSWREVMAPLSKLGTVIAYDRPASGLTERPLAGHPTMPGGARYDGRSPYSAEAQADQLVALMDALGVRQAVLVGNSAGGTIATLTALRSPERVAGLVLVDPAIYTGGGAPGWARPIINSPQMARLGPLVSRQFVAMGDGLIREAWHDPARVTDEVIAGYRKPLQAQDWDQGLWELTKASKPLNLADRLGEVRVPTLVITGDDDRIVPTAESVRLAGELPNAELVVIPNCGHLPQEECPAAFLAATETFLTALR